MLRLLLPCYFYYNERFENVRSDTITAALVLTGII